MSVDAIIIAGPKPQEFLGGEIRERMRLTVDGFPRQPEFPRALFRCRA